MKFEIVAILIFLGIVLFEMVEEWGKPVYILKEQEGDVLIFQKISS